MKYKNEYFIQISRKLFNEEKFKKLPYQSKWIYTILCENEHRFTGENENLFFRSDKDLSKDCGMSLRTMQRYKKYLIDEKIIEFWHMHFINTDTGKKSEKKVSAYRLLE